MKYDDASWHSGSGFPEGSPIELSGTHIALFMKWCFQKGWAGELHLEEEPEDTEKVISGELGATEYFFKYCDGKLTDEDFTEEGNAFASVYYGDDGHYLSDYANLFGDLMFLAPENEHDYSKFKAKLDSRYTSKELSKKDDTPTEPVIQKNLGGNFGKSHNKQRHHRQQVGWTRYRSPVRWALNVQKEIPNGAEGKLFVWRDKLRTRLCGYADCALSLSDLS